MTVDPALAPIRLLLEARDELTGAEHDLGVLRRAAFERLALDLADEIHQHLVAGLRGAIVEGGVGLVLRDQFVQRRGDLLLARR